MDPTGSIAIAIGVGITIGTYELLVALGIIATAAMVVTVAKLESEYHYIENEFTTLGNDISYGINWLAASLKEELNGHRSTKNGKGRTRNKHEEGLSRKMIDMRHGEKGDKVRKSRKNPQKRKNLWILALLGLDEDDEDYWW